MEEPRKLEIMREGGKRLGKILKALLKDAKPGMETARLDKRAQDLIDKSGGTASFKTVNGYRFATCMCVNDEVVHGIPDDRLKEGDILCIDAGLLYKGFHTDSSWTVRIKNPGVSYKNARDVQIDKFLKTGEQALFKAVKEAKVGNRVGHISKAIQETVEGAGYSVVKALVGHGVGRRLHEEPQIPGFADKPLEKTPLLTEGMTVAIEVIYNEGKDDVVYKNDDGWTIVTKDGSMSAVFEHTVAIMKKEPQILTL